MKPTIQTENDILALRGQPESARLEFKSSGLLAKTKDELIEDLSREISAFANSEGGEIIIGMREKKEGKTRVAEDIDDGVDASQISVEWLQQIAQSNVSPYLPGLRVRRILLSGPKHGRCAFAIYVPQGSTAYQASDKRYYGRSEYQVQALPDHEIRLRMMKGRIAEARLEITECRLLTADEELATRTREIATSSGHRILRRERRMVLEAPRRAFDELSIRSEVINVGEVTIRDFLLVLSCDPPFALESAGSTRHEERELRFRFSQPEIVEHQTGMGPIVHPQGKVFPGDRLAFPDKWSVRVPDGLLRQDQRLSVRWAVLLDDAPPSSGEVELNDFLKPPLEREGRQTEPRT